MFLVFAVFFDGLDIIVTGADSKVAQGLGRIICPSGLGWGAAEISKDKLKLFAFAVPETCRNLKLAVMEESKGTIASGALSPVSDTTDNILQVLCRCQLSFLW